MNKRHREVIYYVGKKLGLGYFSSEPSFSSLFLNSSDLNSADIVSALNLDLRFGIDDCWPTLTHKAFYNYDGDYVHMPYLFNFQSINHYKSILFHEITHWTGHDSRLNRPMCKWFFTDEGIAKEEIIAELGSALLCADHNIEFMRYAYIYGYLRFTRYQDRVTVFEDAARLASQAAEYVNSQIATAAARNRAAA